VESIRPVSEETRVERLAGWHAATPTSPRTGPSCLSGRRCARNRGAVVVDIGIAPHDQNRGVGVAQQPVPSRRTTSVDTAGVVGPDNDKLNRGSMLGR